MEQARCRNHARAAAAGAAATCSQHDVEEWLASGPSTRLRIRSFLGWAKRSGLIRFAVPCYQQQLPASALTQEQRLTWLKELLKGDSGTLACRVAGILLLLYAQPLTKIASLKYSAVVSIDGETRIMLGLEPIPVPLPFAAMLNTHLTARPNLRTAGGGGPANPWLFPGVSAGHHLTAQRIMRRLRMLGINLRGARNTALQTMVSEVPPPLVAELLGYTYNSTQRHADVAAQSWAQYSSARPKPKSCDVRSR